MPRYDYKCPKGCVGPDNGVFEIDHPIMEERMFPCPDCGAEMEQVFSPPSFILKGTGFYSTDNNKGATRP